MWHGTSWRRQLSPLRAVAGQAHFPFCPACTTENDTAKLTSYGNVSTFLCGQVWQHYTCVQNCSNLLSLNATYRLMFSEIIPIKTMEDRGQSVLLDQSAIFLCAHFDFCRVTTYPQGSCIHCLITVPLYMILQIYSLMVLMTHLWNYHSKSNL